MKISVILTAFNSAKSLPKAIQSFLDQNYAQKELLIIDDISTDETHQIINDYVQKFPQFIRWIKEKDYGIAHARNLALKHASGDLIGFLGGNDLLHKNFFEEMAYYIAKNPHFDVIYFNSYDVAKGANFVPSALKKVTLENLIEYAPIGCAESFYYRREIFKDAKFNEKNRYCASYELNLALASQRGCIFYPVNITAVFNGENETTATWSNELKESLEIVAVQFKYAKNTAEKLKIFWRTKKLIIKNRNTFHQISGSI